MMSARNLAQDGIVARLDELPSLPTIVYELSRVINDPMSSTSDVEKLMANDQSLTAKVLRLVNSSYYAIPGGVSSLSRAIAYIGFDTINQLVLGASILKALESKNAALFDTAQFWKHAIGVAVTAETIAKFVRHPMPADLFTCGLVHDMGKVVLFTIAPDTMGKVVSACQADGSSFFEAEIKLDVPLHTDLGLLLAQRWKLPLNIQAAVRDHHHKDKSARTPDLSAELHRDVDIVFLANLMTHAMKFGHSGHDKILGAPTEVLERLTIHPDQDFKALVQEIKAGLDRADDFLRVLGGEAA